MESIGILILSLLILIIFLILALLRKRELNSVEFENSILNVMSKLGIDRKIGEISTIAQEIQQNYRNLDKMLRVPTERGAFGEIALEKILADSLPPDMFGIREKLFKNIIPDAYIKSTAGIICVDSKFPLENFRKMLEVDGQEKDNFKKKFIKDVQGHFEKVLQDYIQPEAGTADFAFVFIPSEGVYFFLINEAYDILMDYAKKGIQVVSPITFVYKIELVKAGIQAKKLSEEANKIKNDIINISKAFESVDKTWRTFYETHLRQAWNKAEEVNNAYKRVKEEFEKISRFSELEKNIEDIENEMQ